VTVDQYVVSIYYKFSSKELGHTKFKSPMGTVFFTCRPPSFWSRRRRRRSESKSCFVGAENRTASSLWVGGFPVSTDFVFSKLLWVLEPFEVGFFVREKVTKIDLALKVVIKNQLKLVCRLQRNCCESKLIWAYNCLKFILERFFCLRKTRSKLSIYQIAYSSIVAYNSDWP